MWERCAADAVEDARQSERQGPKRIDVLEESGFPSWREQEARLFLCVSVDGMFIIIRIVLSLFQLIWNNFFACRRFRLHHLYYVAECTAL